MHIQSVDAPSDRLSDFLHNAHLFASVVREVVEERYLQQVAGQDITVSQLNLLRLIAVDGGHQVNEIARMMGVSPAAASKSVDKLVRMGLVRREAQPGNRRAMLLTLRQKGDELVREYDRLKEEKLLQAFGELAPGELNGITKALERVTSAVLRTEPAFSGICMKCRANYAEYCPLRTLSDGCIYASGPDPSPH